MPNRYGITHLLKDRIFWAAICAAPLFYALYGVTLYKGSVLSLSFIFNFQLFFTLIIIYPILEELAFRGFLQTSLSRLFIRRAFIYKITLANLITSILFSMVHLVGHSFIWSAIIFFPSLIFGYFKDKYGSTQPGIFLHIFYNSGYYILFWSPAG